ncbi:MAG: signal recognition particle protein [Candidatus Marinimicrobia bacterium]|nr:signal recognition particle protein [Candidatus Neomarinimicrobiota bacterium]
MFEQLQNRLESVVKTLKGHGKITEDNVSEASRQIRRALLEADVNFKVARDFVNHIQKKATGEKVIKSVSPGQQFIKILNDELTEFLGGESVEIKFNKNGPTKIVMAGLQGAGKTTTVAKLACFLKNKHRKNPIVIAADLQRPGAINQLKVMADNAKVDFYGEKTEEVLTVVDNGLKYAKDNNNDVIIVDTAGRLHVDNELMKELKKIISLTNPSEILYVADGMTGQDAVNSSKAFNNQIDISGIVLTKMDGDSRGGAALSIRKVTGKSIKFIGNGENVEGLDIFHPNRLANRILGMGDVISLVEKAQEVIDNDEAEKLAKKMVSKEFNFVDFQQQMKQIQKMGPVSDLMKMMPGMNKLSSINVNEKQFIWINAMISSMTKQEKLDPKIINGSRRKRIAKGSGRSLFEINQLLKQFFQMKKMMAGFSKKRFKGLPFNL